MTFSLEKPGFSSPRIDDSDIFQVSDCPLWHVFDFHIQQTCHFGIGRVISKLRMNPVWFLAAWRPDVAATQLD